VANGQTIVTWPTVPTTPQDQQQRYYALLSTTNLLRSWQGVAGWTNLQGQGQVLSHTNSGVDAGTLYRGQVWLAP
jgi:hypothetical protein